jgi:centromere-localized protein 2
MLIAGVKMQDTAGAGTSGKAHTLASILPEMEGACEDLEAEIAELDGEAERIMQEMQGIVGGLSDLRYGKFAQPVGGGEVREEVLEGLKGLRDVCGRLGAGSER